MSGLFKEPQKFGNWEEFVDFVNKLKVPDRRSHGLNPPVLFRGQRNVEWKLDDSLIRRTGRSVSILEYYTKVKHALHPMETLLEKRWICKNLAEIAEELKDYDSGSIALHQGLDSYEFLLFLRHHGFPSPILDWSRSPFVASFFAFRDAGAEDMDSIVYAMVPTQRGHSLAPSQPRLFRAGQHISANVRHYAQQSDYTYCVQYDEENKYWSFVSQHQYLSSNENVSYEIYPMVLPGRERLRVLKSLNHYNLNAFSLFGSAESLAETMAFQEFDSVNSNTHPLRPRKWSDI